ncbi:hypothetical protein [Ensifer adhaerens]|uniref:hypothetical protein n=1 Tax=Ensifer adhaerens TaxID=106592 RepID=UPI001569C5A2|nr:hypothetical protein [Ensifer adhaerens]
MISNVVGNDPCPISHKMLRCAPLADTLHERNEGNDASAVSAVLKRVWVASTILGETAFGAFHGWQRHGVVGAIALGFVAGAFLPTSPRLLVELLT